MKKGKNMSTLVQDRNEMYTPELEDFVVRQIGKYQSRFACPRCHAPTHRIWEDDLRGHRAIKCSNIECMIGNNRTNYHFDNAATILLPGYYKIARNPQKMLKLDWYHLSTRSPDELEFSSGKDMHVGQIDTIRGYYGVSYRWKQGYYLYRLRFTPDTVLSDDILRDKNKWDGVKEILENGYDNAGNKVDAYGYVNRWEALGSVSIISRRDKLEVMDVYENIIPEELTNPF